MAADDRAPTADAAGTEQRPHLRIVRGDPTPEEVAALVAVLAAASGGGDDPPPPRSRWASHERLMGAAPGHGPGQWRASALPR